MEFYGPNRGTFLVSRSDFRLKILSVLSTFIPLNASASCWSVSLKNYTPVTGSVDS